MVGELPVMPTSGAITTVNASRYASSHSHADEKAAPGYYRVGLPTYGVQAELTRDGPHRLAAVHLPG